MQKPCGDEVLSYECPLYDLLIASNFDSDSGLARVTLLGSGGHARDPCFARTSALNSVGLAMTLIKQISVAFSNHADGSQIC